MFNELTITYLFFSGTGAGALGILAYLILAVTLFPRSKTAKRLLDLPGSFMRRGFIAAFGSLVFATGLLLLDLPNPAKAVKLLVVPSFSVMSLGSFFLLFATVSALLYAARPLVARFRLSRTVRIAAAAFSLAVAILLAGYTGVLLMGMPANHAWHTLLVPVLFMLSAFSTGAALIWVANCWVLNDVCAAASYVLLERSDAIAVGVKAIATAVFVLFLSGLLGAPLSDIVANPAFRWPLASCYAVCSIIIPLGFGLVAGIRGEARWMNQRLLAVLSASILAGGVALRFWVVGLGLLA